MHDTSANITVGWTGPASAKVWAGRVLSGLFVAFMLFDGGIKLPPLQVVTDTMAGLGWPTDSGTARMLGGIGLGSTLLYVWPRTALLGAVLLTGYLGGAIATQIRIGAPLFSHILFGIYMGGFMWGGLMLRDGRVAEVLGLKRQS